MRGIARPPRIPKVSSSTLGSWMPFCGTTPRTVLVSKPVGNAEKMGDYWLFALKFGFNSTQDVRDGAEALRQERNLPPNEPIWVLDAGFFAAVLDEFRRKEDRRQEVQHLRYFADGIALFQIPPNY